MYFYMFGVQKLKIVCKNYIKEILLNNIVNESVFLFSRVAQLVEHRSYEPKVLGSNPSARIMGARLQMLTYSKKKTKQLRL